MEYDAQLAEASAAHPPEAMHRSMRAVRGWSSRPKLSHDACLGFAVGFVHEVAMYHCPRRDAKRSIVHIAMDLRLGFELYPRRTIHLAPDLAIADQVRNGDITAYFGIFAENQNAVITIFSRDIAFHFTVDPKST